jgi:hypothetical protein
MLMPTITPEGFRGPKQYGGKPIRGQWDGSRFVWQYKGRTHKVARLVCEAFNGAPPDKRSVCMHVDENSRNNAPANLRWGSQRENLNAPGFLAYCRGRVGDRNPNIVGRKRKAERQRAA